VVVYVCDNVSDIVFVGVCDTVELGVDVGV
jgi:hypothetical protein